MRAEIFLIEIYPSRQVGFIAAEVAELPRWKIVVV